MIDLLVFIGIVIFSVIIVYGPDLVRRARQPQVPQEPVPLWRQLLNMDMPDPDASFMDSVRFEQCIADLGADTMRANSLITAYWSGRLTTDDFVRRFESGSWPDNPVNCAHSWRNGGECAHCGMPSRGAAFWPSSPFPKPAERERPAAMRTMVLPPGATYTPPIRAENYKRSFQ